MSVHRFELEPLCKPHPEADFRTQLPHNNIGRLSGVGYTWRSFIHSCHCSGLGAGEMSSLTKVTLNCMLGKAESAFFNSALFCCWPLVCLIARKRGDR